jgi:hypothetical protein
MLAWQARPGGLVLMSTCDRSHSTEYRGSCFVWWNKKILHKEVWNALPLLHGRSRNRSMQGGVVFMSIAGGSLLYLQEMQAVYM